METLIITDELKNWTPNIAEIGDRLIMGPQRNVLEKIQGLNTRYDLSLGITRTYRWKPGYMDQIKEYMATRFLEPHMKRKISTYFNQIDNKRWGYTDLRDQLNSIDNKLLAMRQRNTVFQDNGELIERVWEAVMDKFKTELKDKEEYYNVYIGHYKFEFDQSWRVDEDQTDKPCIVFVYNLPKTICNYFIGNTAYSIPVYETTLTYTIDLDNFLYRISANLDWLEGESDIILSSNFHQSRNYGTSCPHHNQWAGSYHREYINEVSDDGYNRGHNQLLHPYLSSEEYSATNRRFKLGDETYKIAYACVGDYGNELANNISKLSLGSIYAQFYNWHTVFNAVSTQPMNHARTMFFGMHKGMDTEEFQNVISTKIDNCRIKRNSTHGPKTYCDDYECLNRKTCSYYNYDPDKAVAVEPEQAFTEEDLPFDTEHEVVADNADNIHGGEEPANYREEMDRINDVEPDPPVEEITIEQTIEEQMIIWAAQQGGALNIANNERNENG